MFVSRRGFHSTAATASFGDVEAQFLSAKIQPTFNKWDAASLSKVQGAYIPEINSIAYAVTEKGQTKNNAVWLFNITFKAWYRWPDTDCEALITQYWNDETKPLFGTTTGRIIRGLNDTFTDFGTTGIVYRIKTGSIYPGQSIHGQKQFTRIHLLYKPKANFSFTGKFKIDNLSRQDVAFTQTTSGDRDWETNVYV